MKRVCEGCGAKLEIEEHAPTPRFCSDECRMEVENTFEFDEFEESKADFRDLWMNEY